MGLDTEIRRLLREEWAIQAFLDNGEAMKANKLKPGGVEIEDGLTRLLHVTTAAHSSEFTGQELYETLKMPIHAAFTYSKAAVYVLMFDDEQKKPKEKARTQAKRAAASDQSIKPYKSNSVFCDAGITSLAVLNREDDDEDYGDEGAVAAATATTKIDLRRLAKSRWLRRKLYTYFAHKFSQDTFIPEGSLLLFEYESDSVLQYPSSAAWPSSITKPTTFKHNHSESDPSCAYWAGVFHEKQVVITSTDTDIIGIFAAVFGKEGKKMSTSLWWRYDKKVLVSLRMLIQLATMATGLTADQFMMYCISNGTDYVDDKKYARGFGPTYMLSAMRQCHRSVQAMFDACLKNDPLVVATHFDKVLRVMYTNGRTQEIKAHMEKLGKPRPPKPIPPPTIDAYFTKTGSQKRTKRTREEMTAKPLQYYEPHTWEQLQVTYGNSKSYVLPSKADIVTASKEITFNVNFWRAQACWTAPPHDTDASTASA
jgi:hypothetical protein